jgi:hypothetical protein
MKKKVKLYIVKRCEEYEPSYIMCIYSKLSNAKRKVKKLEKEEGSPFYYFDIFEREIEDMYEED